MSTTYCHPVISENELPIKPPSRSVVLLKLHGDLHHPDRLIVTEKDYDTFIDRYPLLATYLSNLLISRTPLFIGYSLGDPDFRQIWQVIGDRLGDLRRPAYSISIEMSRADVRRFERRGVRAINIQKASSYSETLTKLFNELRGYWLNSTVEKIIPRKEETKSELVLPPKSSTRLCLFVIPYRLQLFYQTNVFPIVESYGFVPLTAEDVVSPSGNILAKEMALFDRAEIVVIEASSLSPHMGILALNRAAKLRKSVLLIAEPKFARPIPEIKDWTIFDRIERPKDIFVNYERFLLELEDWFKANSDMFLSQLEEEPYRLLRIGEYRAAFISAMTLLESSLHDFIMEKEVKRKEKRPIGLYQIFKIASQYLELSNEEFGKVNEWIKKRNRILHENKTIYHSTATRYVSGILDLTQRIRKKTI